MRRVPCGLHRYEIVPSRTRRAPPPPRCPRRDRGKIARCPRVLRRHRPEPRHTGNRTRRGVAMFARASRPGKGSDQSRRRPDPPACECLDLPGAATQQQNSGTRFGSGRGYWARDATVWRVGIQPSALRIRHQCRATRPTPAPAHRVLKAIALTATQEAPKPPRWTPGQTARVGSPGCPDKAQDAQRRRPFPSQRPLRRPRNPDP